jgi:hypothetical protein
LERTTRSRPTGCPRKLYCDNGSAYVEVWFGIIERQAIHRGTFGNVRELTSAIRTFITGWNKRAHPFVWTKTAEEILKKADRQSISNTVL